MKKTPSAYDPVVARCRPLFAKAQLLYSGCRKSGVEFKGVAVMIETAITADTQERKKSTNKPKLLSPNIFRWGRGLPREGVGAKKFGMSLETREINFLGRAIPGFCWDIRAAPEKFEKKKSLCSTHGP